VHIYITNAILSIKDYQFWGLRPPDPTPGPHWDHRPPHPPPDALSVESKKFLKLYYVGEPRGGGPNDILAGGPKI